MRIYPAIDLKNGGVVRLTYGDYGKVSEYSIKPVEAALSFKSCGAERLHVVDLDGAKDGALSNFDTVSEIVRNAGMFVEIGGGIRSEDRIEKYISAGANRVILGTAAVKNPEFLRRAVADYGERIAVGVDAKNGLVATDGWLEVTEINGLEFCARMWDIGVSTVIYTDISRDGALSGTNLPVYEELSKIKGLDVIASGGISFMYEIERLRDMGIHGAIIGKALYDGKLELSEAIKTAREVAE